MILKSFFVIITRIFLQMIIPCISLAQSSPESDLWINTTYQAEDLGIRYGKLPQCEAWNLWWKLQIGEINPTAEIIDLLSIRRVEISLNSIVQLVKFGLPKYLLSKHKVVHINFKKVCRNYSRYLLIDSFSAANNYETGKKTFLSVVGDRNDGSYVPISTKKSWKPDILEIEAKKPNILFTTKYNQNYVSQPVDRSPLLPPGEIRIINPTAVQITYQIDTNFEQNSTMIVVRSQKVADFYKLGEISSVFQIHKGLEIDREKVCVAEKLGTENIDKFCKTQMKSRKAMKGVFDSEMMSNVIPLSSSVLMPFLNRSHYDSRLSHSTYFFLSVILHFIFITNISRSPPIILEGEITEVFFGILIQSMSNFDQSTMDYDMDIWLRMAWHDRRLAHQFDRPILVNDENMLKKIWRPSPFFQNAKEAEYHRMTTLNFWLYIFPNGEIFFETHLYLKPSCKLILCKYPHDNQVCSLKITAIASGQNSIRYSWFPRLSDAIRMNKLMESEELYVEKYYKRYCDGVRKTGNFSCLEASCQLKRSLGYHMTRTYIPTATCVVFSWISVWLPEEFVTGRIFGSLTLFLTLSAESSAVKEVLPKAIDLWFGFTASFVFITMLEALIVISLEYKSRELRKKAESGLNDMSRYQMMLLMLESGRYHSTARHIDRYCRTLYPVVFLLFLIIYYFVITEGDETKCLQRSSDEL
uniref:Neur_chan_LBD domain-containing protein n=1 Tax=Wuchereria bancrofti TaxID=6293 RepID=A0A1I8EYW7_WUCBA